MLSRETEAYKKSSKEIKKRIRYIKNQKLRHEAELINNHATRREIEELFRQMKTNGSVFKDTKRNNKCHAEKLKEYFFDHFNKTTDDNITPDELLKAPEYIQTLQNTNININHVPPDISEIKNVLLTLKNGKASNDIPAEFLKYATDSAK